MAVTGAGSGVTLLAMVVIVNALGSLLGRQVACLFGFVAHHRLTSAIEVGMQNAALGVVWPSAWLALRNDRVISGC